MQLRIVLIIKNQKKPVLNVSIMELLNVINKLMVSTIIFANVLNYILEKIVNFLKVTSKAYNWNFWKFCNKLKVK